MKTIIIENRTYRMTPMAPWEGSAFTAKVTGLISKGIADADGLFEGGDIEKMVGAAIKMLPNIPPDQFTALARQALLKSEHYMGVECPDGPLDKGIFDMWFSKHPGDYFPIAIWAIKENSAGFFVRSGAAWNSVVAALMPSASLSIDQ